MANIVRVPEKQEKIPELPKQAGDFMLTRVRMVKHTENTVQKTRSNGSENSRLMMK